MITRSNEVTAPDAASPLCSHSGGYRRGTGEFFRYASRFVGCLLTLLMAVSVAVSAEPISKEDGVSGVVAHIMKTLAGGTLLVTPPPDQPVAVNGWVMPYCGGKKIWRSDLHLQCSVITPYGWRAVPELLNWLDHKDTFVRYIAADSLETITGLHPTFYYFGTPHQTFNGDSGWFDVARNTWSKWYEDLVRDKKPNA